MKYYLATNISQFMINSSTGVLTATRSLDYEKDPHIYIFTVGAVLAGSSTVLTMVIVMY